MTDLVCCITNKGVMEICGETDITNVVKAQGVWSLGHRQDFRKTLTRHFPVDD